MTRVGQQLYHQVRRPLDLLAAAEREVLDRSEAPRGLLRVAVPPLLAQPLAEMAAVFGRQHREVELELITATRFVRLTEEGFDAALRAGVLRDPTLVQRKLMTAQVRLYASPAYLEERGHPASIEELATHTLLRGHTGAGEPMSTWPLRGGGRFPVHGGFSTNDGFIVRAACLAGMGIALLSEVPTPHPSLVPLLPEVGTQIGLHVVYPERGLLPPRTRAFIDAAIAFFPRWAQEREHGARDW